MSKFVSSISRYYGSPVIVGAGFVSGVGARHVRGERDNKRTNVQQCCSAQILIAFFFVQDCATTQEREN